MSLVWFGLVWFGGVAALHRYTDGMREAALRCCDTAGKSRRSPPEFVRLMCRAHVQGGPFVM